MNPRPADLAGHRFDVVVVGGGVNGGGIAREAALAGYRTLLVERLDFGAGTTSRATRLIHGGLRYLEHWELGLVHESLTDREDLVRSAPHLVRALRLLVPVYAGDARPGWKIRAGLTLYDALSFRKSLPRHRSIPLRDVDSVAPGLSRAGLRAAFTFFDAQVEFPERLVIESVRDLTDAGGAAMNHTSCTAIISPGHVLRGVALRDELSGATCEVEAKVVVNAGGPWADDVLAGSDAQRHDQLIGGTKGSHLVVDWPDAPRQAIFATAKQDGRPFFILPWYRYTLIGTTDLRFDGDPSSARCTESELGYLLDEATRLFPSAPPKREHVLYTYSGVRPLPYTPKGDESSITRSHFIIDHVKRGGPAGLLSIVGGKLTTYRSLSRLAVSAIAKHVAPSCVSTTEAINAGGWKLEAGSPLSLYGTRAGEVGSLAASDPLLRQPICEHNPETLAQVAYAVEREQALTLADVLLRRLPCGWSACHALDGAESAARVMAAHFDWDEAQVAAEVGAYRSELNKTLVPVSAVR